MNRVFLFLAVLMVMLFVGSAVAKDLSGDEDDAIVLDEMVVTASRLEESVSSVPANVTVVTADDIADSTAKDVADLLRTEAGVYVKDITGGRRSYTVDLRGFGETAALNTLVLVDGRRTNQADLSGTDWTQIPLEQVERIEIIRGGRASVFYGDNAAGGVINIITRKGIEDHGGLKVQFGSYDTIKASAYRTGYYNGLSYMITGSYLDTNGYRENSDNEAEDLGAELGYRINDKLSMSFSSGYHEDTARLPGAITDSEFAAGAERTDSMTPDDYQDSEDYYFKFVPEARIISDGIVKMALSYRKRSTIGYSSGDWGYFVGDTEIDTVAANPNMVIDKNVFGFLHSLNFGVDYAKANEDITNTSVFFGDESTGKFDLEKRDLGYFVHDELTVTPEFSVSGGYRYDTATYAFATDQGEIDPDSRDLDASLYTMGINYKINPDSNFYMSYSKSHRYPVMDELFSYISNAIDPSLVPQTADDYEVGVRYVFDRGMALGLNLFYVETDDEIYLDLISYTNTNMDGQTIRKGIEVTAENRFGWGKLDVNYTYTDAEIDGGTYDGKTFPDVPQHQSGFNVLVDHWKPLSVILNGKYVGERYFISDWTNSFTRQDDYFVMNAKLKYTWDGVTAFVDINNLLNTEYEEYVVISSYTNEKSYYPSPEINFLIGVSVDF